MIFLASEGCFWPLTASMTSEAKKNHAYVYPYRNLRKFTVFLINPSPSNVEYVAAFPLDTSK